MSKIACLRAALSAALLTPCLSLIAIPAWADAMADATANWAAGDARSATIVLKDHLERGGADPAARMLLGRVYLDLMAGAAAEQELQRAIAEGGLNPADYQVDLAEAYLLQAKFAQVIQDPTSPSATDPTVQAQLYAIRGEAYLALDKPEQAGLEFGKALGLVPDQARAVLGQAKLALKQGDKVRAREFVDQAAAAHPQDAQTLQALGEFEFSAGRFAQAEAAFTRAIEAGRSDWMPLYKRTLARLELGQLDPAAADIAAAAKQFPQFTGLSYARGILALKKGQPESAFAELSLYLRARPGDPQAAYLAGMALLQLQRFQEAEEYLGRAQKAFPSAPGFALALAQARLARDDFKGAEAVLRPFADQQEPAPAPELLILLRQAVQGQGRAGEAKDLAATVAAAQPEDPQSRLRLAESLTAAGDPTGAVRELRTMLKASPDNGLARLMLIRLLLDKPDAKAALAEAQALVELTPTDPRAHNALALAQQVGGDPAAARTAFARALELDPGFADAAFNLARIEQQERNPAAARKLYEQVLAAQPGESNAVLLLAQLDVAEGKRANAFDRLTAALAKDPKNLALRANLARGYLAAGMTQEAQRTLQDTPPAAVGTPEFLLLQAQVALAVDQPFTAITPLEALVRLRPASADAHLLLANAFGATKNLAGMQQHLLEGYRISPKSALAQETLTQVYGALPDAQSKRALLTGLKGQGGGDTSNLLLLEARLAIGEGNYPDGLKLLGDLRRARPNDQAVFAEFLTAQVKAGELVPATQTAQAWVEAHPDDVQARGRLAQIYLRRGRTEKAIETYRDLVKADPKNTEFNNNLAMLLLEKQPVEALAYAQAAVAAAPQDPATADTLGAALLANGDAKGAVPTLARAYAALPTEPTVAFHYAQALSATGDPAQARTVLLTTLERSFPEKAQAQALLGQLAP